jgi:hypothetical protein
MRIDSKAKIAGLPIVRVRDALKRVARRDWTAERLRSALGAEAAEIAAVLAALQAAGYVEPAPEPTPGLPVRWRTTPLGRAFALATARPVSRVAARRHLDGLLARLAEVRDDDRWLYTARRVYLFGSFLDPAAETVGGVDLAVELVRKESDEAVHRERERAYIQRQWDDGRIFRSFERERLCPSDDVLKYVKHRSWILSLHPLDALPAEAPSRLLYEDPGA